MPNVHAEARAATDELERIAGPCLAWYRRRFRLARPWPLAAWQMLGWADVHRRTGEVIWKSAQLRHKTIATWVAQNQIVKYRANRIWGNTKSQSGKVEMANIDWVWRMKISGTDDPSLRRLEVEVTIEGEEAVKARITGFIARL